MSVKWTRLEKAARNIIAICRDEGFGEPGAETCDRRELVETAIREAAKPLVEALEYAASRYSSTDAVQWSVRDRCRNALAAWKERESARRGACSEGSDE